MDHASQPESLSAGWVDSIARGEADLAAGRVTVIDIDALCRDIAAEADDMERNAAMRPVSPA